MNPPLSETFLLLAIGLTVAGLAIREIILFARWISGMRRVTRSRLAADSRAWREHGTSSPRPR